MYLTERRTRHAGRRMFIAALFTVAKNWKLFKGSLVAEWI
jgi:hypothetical protein